MGHARGYDAAGIELAERFAMTRTGVAKHVRLLEDVAGWVDAYRAMLHERLDRLDVLLERLQRTR